MRVLKFFILAFAFSSVAVAEEALEEKKVEASYKAATTQANMKDFFEQRISSTNHPKDKGAKGLLSFSDDHKTYYLMMSYGMANNAERPRFYGADCADVDADINFLYYKSIFDGGGIGCNGVNSTRYAQGKIKAEQNLTMGLGVNLSNYLHASAEFTFRRNMKYKNIKPTLDTYYDDDGFMDLSKSMDAKFNNYSFILNLYIDLMGRYDFKGNKRMLSPYIGVGIGVAMNESTYFKMTGEYEQSKTWADFTVSETYNYEMLLGDESNYDLAKQFTIGLAMQISTNMVLDFGYRYLDLGYIETGNDFYFSREVKNNEADRDGYMGTGKGRINKLESKLRLNEVFAGIRMDF